MAPYGKIKADKFVYDNSGSDVEVTLSSLGNKVDAASPTFTGTVTIPTPTSGDNSTKAASTAFVVAGFAPKASPALTGTATGVNLTLSGNLTVNGTTTTVATTNTTITDNLIELNSGASSNANDAGILIERGSTGDNAILAWDESADRFVVGTTTGTASSTGDITIAECDIKAGNFIGNCSGQATTAATATTVTVTANESTDELLYLAMVDGTSSSQGIEADSSLQYNPSTGVIATTGGFTDSKGDVRSIPMNTQSSAYVLVAADAGKAVSISSGGVTVNNSIFSAGQAVTIINNSAADQTITQGSGVTIYNSADASTGNRTLAARGMATLWFRSAGAAYISGAGLS